ncbi:hypothetical protein [Nocardia carnea]|uniref:Uncharacterized protein n=1 Tax=Nocardia carnea TaxID=37328 RepID=A0ABW7TNV1_9NOCA|nr:hypothetical protein [Nocardia carnea]
MAAESSRPADGGSLPPAIWAGAALVVATLGALTRPFEWAATGLVVIIAGAVLVYAVRRPSEPISPGPRLRNGLLLWSLLLLVISSWELFALSRQESWNVPDRSHPTLSTLLDPALEQGPGRWAGWLIWLAAGWRLLR